MSLSALISDVSPAVKCRLSVLYVIFLPKPFNPPRRINKLLLAGKEGVAGRANFYLYILGGGAGFDNITARAGDFCHFVLGMNSVSHISSKNCPTPK